MPDAPVPDPPAPRQLLSSMKPHERAFFRRMEARGETIDWIAPDTIAFLPTNDFRWTSRGGLLVELKSPTNPKYSSIQRTIREAVKRATAADVVKNNFILDFGERPLDLGLRARLTGYNAGSYPIARLWVLASSGSELTEIILRAET